MRISKPPKGSLFDLLTTVLSCMILSAETLASGEPIRAMMTPVMEAHKKGGERWFRSWEIHAVA